MSRKSVREKNWGVMLMLELLWLLVLWVHRATTPMSMVHPGSRFGVELGS